MKEKTIKIHLLSAPNLYNGFAIKDTYNCLIKGFLLYYVKSLSDIL